MLYIQIPETERQNDHNDPTHIYSSHQATGSPAKSSLKENYPNPFNLSTCIPFKIQKDGFAELKILNQQGILVKTILSEKMNKGTFRSHWNGYDNQGTLVASGIYFAVLQTDGQYSVQKMMLLK